MRLEANQCLRSDSWTTGQKGGLPIWRELGQKSWLWLIPLHHWTLLVDTNRCQPLPTVGTYYLTPLHHYLPTKSTLLGDLSLYRDLAHSLGYVFPYTHL